MKTFAAATLLIASVCFAQPKPAPRSPAQILSRVDDLLRGTSSHGKMTMRVVTAEFTRELQLEQWSKGKDRFLVRILAPQKEKGTATLRSAENIWNYLPKVERVVKVPTSMMGGTWMGSHFNNDDLVKQSRLAESYTFQQTFEGERAGVQVLELTLTPKPEAAVVWGKVVVVVRASDELPLETRYFDEDLALARTLSFADYKLLGGRRVPALLKVVPAGKPGESTEIRYLELELDLPLQDDFFSLPSLKG